MTVASVALLAGCHDSTAATPRADTSLSGKVVRAIPKKEPALPKATPDRAQRKLDAAVGEVVAADHDHVAVALEDLTKGTSAVYNGNDDEFVTASIVKADIVSTLLYQNGGRLPSDDLPIATSMIENSDNDSATDLFDQIGGARALDTANKVLGLTATEANNAWGETTTTATDQLQLLRDIFTDASPLDANARHQIQSLMGDVESDQQWGVPVAASSGTQFYVKNGWLPNPDLWEINSIGDITHAGQIFLIAVLSDDNATEVGGIDEVQEVVNAAVAALAKA